METQYKHYHWFFILLDTVFLLNYGINFNKLFKKVLIALFKMHISGKGFGKICVKVIKIIPKTLKTFWECVQNQQEFRNL